MNTGSTLGLSESIVLDLLKFTNQAHTYNTDDHLASFWFDDLFSQNSPKYSRKM